MIGLKLAFSITLLLGGLFSPVAAEAQQAAKIPRIGFLYSSSLAVTPNPPEAFRQGLRDLGYVEGRNVVIEYRFAEGKLERLPALAAEAGAGEAGAGEAGADEAGAGEAGAREAGAGLLEGARPDLASVPRARGQGAGGARGYRPHLDG